MMYLTDLRTPLNAWTHFQNLASEAPTATAATTTPHGFQPRIDFIETPEAFEIRAEIPGIDPATIELVLTNGELTIKGTKPEHMELEGYHLHETLFGEFERTFTFPTPVSSTSIKAESKFGVLTIAVAKAPEAISRKIPITIVQ